MYLRRIVIHFLKSWGKNMQKYVPAVKKATGKTRRKKRMQWRCEPVREEWQERPFTPAREIVYRRAARWRAAARYLIRNAMERRGLIYGWSQRELWSPNANTSVAKLQGSLHCRGQVRWRYKWIVPEKRRVTGPRFFCRVLTKSPTYPR